MCYQKRCMRTFSRFVFATSIADSQIVGHKETPQKKKRKKSRSPVSLKVGMLSLMCKGSCILLNY